MKRMCKDCKFCNSSELDMYCHFDPPKIFLIIRDGTPTFVTKSPLVRSHHWCSKFELFYGEE